jgi:hypothetical protein
VYSQSVGINTESLSPLTDLDIQNRITSHNDTLLHETMIPCMTEKQRDVLLMTKADSSAAVSLPIYNTVEDCCNYYSLVVLIHINHFFV